MKAIARISSDLADIIWFADRRGRRRVEVDPRLTLSKPLEGYTLYVRDYRYMDLLISTRPCNIPRSETPRSRVFRTHNQNLTVLV